METTRQRILKQLDYFYGDTSSELAERLDIPAPSIRREIQQLIKQQILVGKSIEGEMIYFLKEKP